jgi:hypothetical protein
MGTLNQENRYRGFQGVYPIVEYAHKIGKNTAEFTVNDLAAFMKWWLKQPQRRDILEATAAQRKVYEADVAAMKQWREDQKMGKNSGKMKNAATSRLPKQFNDELVGDSEIMDMTDVEEVVEGDFAADSVVVGEEVVCSMELTRADVDALLFSISRTFEDYQMEEYHPHTISLTQLKEGLEGI